MLRASMWTDGIATTKYEIPGKRFSRPVNGICSLKYRTHTHQVLTKLININTSDKLDRKVPGLNRSIVSTLTEPIVSCCWIGVLRSARTRYLLQTAHFSSHLQFDFIFVFSPALACSTFRFANSLAPLRTQISRRSSRTQALILNFSCSCFFLLSHSCSFFWNIYGNRWRAKKIIIEKKNIEKMSLR